MPAEIQKNGDEWTLVLVRELRHPPARVWEAITDPAHLREWLRDPQEVKPGARMPRLPLSRGDLAALVDYVEGRK